jgi:alanine racemase
MFETSYIELHSEIYAKNLAFLKRSVIGQSEFCSVIKGNAYGHGDKEFIQIAQAEGVQIFAVFNAFEAYRVQPFLRDESRLIIMGDIDFQELGWAIEHDIEFYIHNLKLLDETIKASQKIGKPALIHLEIETGMHRLGIERELFPDVIERVLKYPENLKLIALCTHYAGSESINNYLRVKKQHKIFENSIKWFRSQELDPFMVHAACSAAAVRYKKTLYDMVRIGILQYGFWPSQETFIEYISKKKKDHSNPLEGIITWKSRVMSLKDVPLGSYVGYGSSYLTERAKKMAIIPVGYSNGFARVLSNQGRVLIHGKRISVAGTVNMNAITVDVTNIPEVQIGDEVVLIGKQGDQTITVSSFGDYSNQLNYELLTRLPMDIPRFIK